MRRFWATLEDFEFGFGFDGGFAEDDIIEGLDLKCGELSMSSHRQEKVWGRWPDRGTGLAWLVTAARVNNRGLTRITSETACSLTRLHLAVGNAEWSHYITSSTGTDCPSFLKLNPTSPHPSPLGTSQDPTTNPTLSTHPRTSTFPRPSPLPKPSSSPS